MARYFLVGSLTWAIPKERTVEVQELQEGDDEDKEGWVAIEPPAEEEGEEDEDQEAEDEETEGEDKLQEDENESQEEKEHDLPRHGLTGAEEEAGEDLALYTPPGPEEFEELADELQAYEVKVFRMAIPMRSKKAKEVTRTTMELIFSNGWLLREQDSRGSGPRICRPLHALDTKKRRHCHKDRW